MPYLSPSVNRSVLVGGHYVCWLEGDGDLGENPPVGQESREYVPI